MLWWIYRQMHTCLVRLKNYVQHFCGVGRCCALSLQIWWFTVAFKLQSCNPCWQLRLTCIKSLRGLIIQSTAEIFHTNTVHAQTQLGLQQCWVVSSTETANSCVRSPRAQNGFLALTALTLKTCLDMYVERVSWNIWLNVILFQLCAPCKIYDTIHHYQIQLRQGSRVWQCQVWECVTKEQYSQLFPPHEDCLSRLARFIQPHHHSGSLSTEAKGVSTWGLQLNLKSIVTQHSSKVPKAITVQHHSPE